MRQSPTSAEARTWALLRGRRMLGLKFRRQHVIGGFIVDFYCAELRLILELDGPAHDDWVRAAYDSVRTQHLESRGYRVFHLRNENVSGEFLRKLLTELIRRSPSPRMGEGVGGEGAERKRV
jgi:very-short-patch-repair endonuclease